MHLGYRADIDGLRAIAVLSVVFFHAGVPGVSGGFVGVDVFFVISGFLITSILQRELEQSNFSLAHFYVRRARRILPALYVMLAVTLGLGYFLLLPLELEQLSKNSRAALLFVSNIVLRKESGYFDVAAELKPALHTWSLSVEEQFYLFWPLILALVNRRGYRVRLWLGILAGLSFVTACIWVSKKPAAAFYLLPSRAWELLLGAAIVLVPCIAQQGLRLRHALSIAGFILVAGSIALLDRTSPFPAWNALWPCLGAALLIASGPDAWLNRYVLANRGLVFIGLISYSLYLWHWPLLAFIRISNLGELPLQKAIIALGVAFLISILSWRYVERPFRENPRSIKPISVLAGYVSVGFAMVMVCTLAIMLKGVPDRMPANVLAAQAGANDINRARDKCHGSMEATILPTAQECSLGGNRRPEVLLWGDSHADAIGPGLPYLPALAGRTIHQMTKTSCPPLLGVDITRDQVIYQECSEFNRSIMAYLHEHPEIRHVVLSARWPVYLTGSGYGAIEEIGNVARYALSLPGQENDPVRRFQVSLDGTVNALRDLGLEVTVIGAVPEMRFNVPTCEARKRIGFLTSVECGLDQFVVEKRIGIVNREIERVSGRPGVVALFPSDVMCNGGVCKTEGSAGELLYYDHNHLSAAGARYVCRSMTDSIAGNRRQQMAEPS